MKSIIIVRCVWIIMRCLWYGPGWGPYHTTLDDVKSINIVKCVWDHHREMYVVWARVGP